MTIQTFKGVQNQELVLKADYDNAERDAQIGLELSERLERQLREKQADYDKLAAEKAGMISHLRECRKALVDLITNKPALAGLLCGSTTLGNLMASLYEFRDGSTNSDKENTDAYVCGLQAQGIDKWIESRDGRWNGTTKEAEDFAAKLRAGGVK